MALFKRDADPAREAADAAAQAEVTRLAALDANQIAAELLPRSAPKARSPRTPRYCTDAGHRVAHAAYGRGANTKPLVPAVLVGMSALERAGLVSETVSGTGSGARALFPDSPGRAGAVRGNRVAATSPDTAVAPRRATHQRCRNARSRGAG